MKNGMHRINILAFNRYTILCAAALALCGCAHDVPPIGCDDSDFDCYVTDHG